MTGTRRPATLVEALERAASLDRGGLRFLDRRERERWLSWPDVWTRSRRVAHALIELGIDRGDRVGLLFPTSPQFVESFFAVLLAGAVPVPIYPPLRLGRLDEYGTYLASLLGAAGVRLLLAEEHVRGALAAVLANLEAPPLALGCRTLEELTPGGPPREASPLPARSRDDLALVQFSSGTTAAPRPVALSHSALIAQLSTLNDQWPDSASTRHSAVSWLPLYHDMGLVGFLLSAMWRPAELTLLAPEVFAARPALWLRAISRYGATISGAPNFAYALTVDKVSDEEMEGVDLSRWWLALNGAEAVTPETIDRFSRRFARWGFARRAMTPVYGLAEAALAVTFSNLEAPPRIASFDRESLEIEREALPSVAGRPVTDLVSLGAPLSGVRLEVRDERGVALAPGRVGRIHTASDCVMTEYLDQPETTAAVLDQGWLSTGDLGFLDLERRELFLIGREKDGLVLRGRKVRPESIEEAAASVEGIRADGVVAVTDPQASGQAGEALLVFAERARKSAVTAVTDVDLASLVRIAVGERTGWRCDQVVILASGSLPRTSSGKLRRAETLRLHRASSLKRGGSVRDQDLDAVEAPRESAP